MLNSAPTSLSFPTAVIVVATCCAAAKCSLQRRNRRSEREKKRVHGALECSTSIPSFSGPRRQRARLPTRLNRRPRYHRSKRILSELAETAQTATRAHVGTRMRAGGPSSLSTTSSSSRDALQHTEVTRQRARQLWALTRKQRRHLPFSKHDLTSIAPEANGLSFLSEMEDIHAEWNT